MRMPSGVTDQYIYFVAVDATDLVTRETGLTGFAVYRSRNGGSATAYTTPTVAELSSSNMPGVYSLLLDEDMTIDSGDDSQEICLHITCSGMAPVTRTIELYRRTYTAGATSPTITGDAYARLGAPAGASVSADVAAVKAVLPAALVSGRIDASVGAMASGVLTATAIASDAITDAKVASDVTIASVTGAVGSVAGLTASDVAAIKAKTDNLPAAPAAVGDIPSAATIADAVHDEVVEGTTTLRQSIRLANAALGGKASGLATSSAKYRDLADTKDRLTATVDADGNRSAVTRDLT